MAIELTPSGPFSLRESIAFAEGFDPAAIGGGSDGVFGCALRDDDGTATAFTARQEDGGTVVVEHDGALSDDRLRAHAERILSLDIDGSGLDEVAARDEIAASLVEEFPGRRPVSFPTPFEAAAWTVLSQRTGWNQAVAAKRRLAEGLGDEVGVGDGPPAFAFPSPQAIVDAGELPGVSGGQRTGRLRGVAEAALEGALDPALLRGFATPEEALEHLEGIHGIGPFSAQLVLARGAGHPDVPPPSAVRSAREALAEVTGLPPEDIDADRVRVLSEPWRPFRTWVFFLLRNRTG